jgi:hypothetical protein
MSSPRTIRRISSCDRHSREAKASVAKNRIDNSFILIDLSMVNDMKELRMHTGCRCNDGVIPAV